MLLGDAFSVDYFFIRTIRRFSPCSNPRLLFGDAFSVINSKHNYLIFEHPTLQGSYLLYCFTGVPLRFTPAYVLSPRWGLSFAKFEFLIKKTKKFFVVF